MSIKSTNPPAYPGTRPRTAKTVGIHNKFDVFSDFSSTWEAHTSLTTLFQQHRNRNLAGLNGYQDVEAINDFYRTNRFDLASHWARSFDASQVVPPATPEAITSPIGRRLVVLMDQHISQSGAILAQTQVKEGLITKAQGLAFFRTLNLIPNATQAQFDNYDALTDIFANGKAVISLFANVSRAISQGKSPSSVPAAQMLAFDQSAYDGFNAYIGASKFFQDKRAGNLAILASAGVPASAPAQDVWNAHLVEVALLIGAEQKYIKAVKAGGAAAAESAATTEAGAKLVLHSNQLAGLQAASVGVPADLKKLPFPFADRIDATIH